MQLAGLFVDALFFIANLIVYAVAGAGLELDYQELRGWGVSVGLAVGMFVSFIKPSIFKALSVKRGGTTQADTFIGVAKDKAVILGLGIAWLLGVAGVPCLNWLPLVALMMICVSSYLKNRSNPGTGWLDWAATKASEINQLNKWHISTVILAGAIVAEVAGRIMGTPLITGLVYVAAVAAAISWLLDKNEVAALNRTKEVIATGRLVAMEMTYEKLDKQALPKSSELLFSAIRERRAAYALSLEIAALAPSTSYYSSIFKTAAKNLLVGQHGVKFQFRDLDSTDAIYRNLYKALDFKSDDYDESAFKAKPRSNLKEEDIGKYEYFQSVEDYKKYDVGLKKILGVMNSVIGESVFFEAEHGLEIIAERGCISQFAFVSCHKRSDGIYLIDQPAVLRVCLASEYKKYIGYELISSSLAMVDRIEPLTVNTKTAQDLAIFYSKTLGIPYESLIAKKKGNQLSKASALSEKVFELVKDEIKGQAEDAVIQALAEKLFDENAELVADMIGECMKDRVTGDLTDVISEFIVGQAVEAGLGLVGDIVSS